MRNRGKLRLIVGLLFRIREIFLAGMARLNLNICPLTILFIEILLLGLTGGTVITFFYPEGMAGNYYDKGYPFISYLSILYASLVLGGISFGLGLRKRLLVYTTRNWLTPSRSILLFCWCFTFFAAFGAFILVFFQAGMEHPMISALRSGNVAQVSIIRSAIAKTIDMRVHNLGLLFLLPLNLIISVFLLRSFILSFASIILLCFFGTFTLAKAPIGYVLIFVVIFRTLAFPLYLKSTFKYLGVIILSLVVLFIFTKYAGLNARTIVKNISARILRGEILDLPYYFEVFSNQKVSLKSLMPPYLVGDQKPAARIVAEHSIEKMFSHLPAGNERYYGILYRNQLRGTYARFQRYPWDGKRQSGSLSAYVSRIEGCWVINAGKAPGKLELYWAKNKLNGRIWFDVYQKWEDLTDVVFGSQAGLLEFIRPISKERYERYSGTLSGDQLSGSYTVRSVSYLWKGTQENRSGLTHASGIDGLWLINTDNASGKLELYWTGNKLNGRIRFDVYQQWEDLSDVVFAPRTGQLEFARPHADKSEKAYYANVVGVANTFFTGEAFAWAGYPGVIVSPFIVMAHLAFFIYLFRRIKKTWFTVYIFSFFFYKVFIGIFGGISYFIFSSIHIVLIIFLTVLIIADYSKRKNVAWFNRIISKLCIL